MTARVLSVALVGMEARPVEVEVDIGSGLPDFQIVGLPSAAVRESRQRVRAAVQNSAVPFPLKKVTVSLAPGDLRKEGAMLDLAIALAIMAADKKISQDRLKSHLFIGELSLDGRLRPVRGVIAAALAAREKHVAGIVVPLANAAEASLVPNVEIIGAQHLAEVVAFIEGALAKPARPELPAFSPNLDGLPDLAEVRGQALARRALEIAAAGHHNLLMVGPPGSGKTMLARRLPGILPPMSIEEALEVTRIWSVAGLLSPEEPIVQIRPFRSPHHHASAAAVIGGGHPYPRPGEVSLANRGVLFLDELPLFSRGVLEGLRQPLEDGIVTVARQGATVKFPAQVSVIAAANPCPCGRAGDLCSVCTCPPGRLEGYASRLSGPLLDRFDLFAEVPRLSEEELVGFEPSESSAVVRERVLRSREFRELRTDLSEDLASLPRAARGLLLLALAKDALSARAVARTVRVARTIADLAHKAEIDEESVAEALQFRGKIWGNR